MSFMGVVSPVAFKLTSRGLLDPTFGVNGIFNQNVLAATTECYGAARQGDKFVTAGYGRDNANESLDFVSLRLTATGQLDTTYATAGVARIDVAGFNDNARNVAVLHDNRVLIIGGGRPTTDNVDGMLVMLTPDGQRDTSFAPNGIKLYDLGGPSDFFWGLALSPDGRRAAITGLRGAAMGGNDDAAMLILTLP